ncbi:MAG: penicillin-binding transpeptidase domain-containing protein [Acidimicrobiales bacterium]
MNRQIKHVVVVLLGCFTLLFVQLNRVQVYDAEALENHPANNRTIQRDFNRPRGKILTRDDVVVARSEPRPGEFFDEQRVYPEGDLYAHTVGYTSFTFGAEGVERTYNDALIGRTAAQELSGLTDLLGGTNPIGDVRLTIRDDMQRQAKQSLGERRGSVVALDPVTGEIFAMWSFPSFDPNRIADNDGSAAAEARNTLLEAEGNPLRSKPYRDIYFPGSTFKVITAAGALERGVATTITPEFEVTDSYLPPLTERPIANFGGSSCGGNLVEMLVVSCNTAFARLGAERLGPAAMIDSAQRFGFNQEPPLDLPVPVASEFPIDFGAEVSGSTPEIPAGVFEDTPSLAQSAIGQNNVSATPLQMALVAAAVANAGQVPVPHVMLAIEDSASSNQTSSFRNDTWLRAMAPETASDLTSAMIQVVERGSAQGLALPGLVIGAKTGTAQLGTDPPASHAWIIAFGGRANERAQLAVAVLVAGTEATSDQTGGRVAAPIARDLFERFFG